jgi:hypothetical protein
LIKGSTQDAITMKDSAKTACGMGEEFCT